MTQRHYFVVEATVDEFGNVTWMIDDDTAIARFADGAIWDEDTQDWIDTASGSSPEGTKLRDFQAHEDLKVRLGLDK